MSIADIKKLSLREKLQVMEMIWDDLRGTVEGADVPQAHKDLLDERRHRVSTGEAKIHSWDEVKGSIGRPC